MPLAGFEERRLELSDELKELADVFLKRIAHHRIEQPVKSPRIEEKLGISGPQVRAIVSYLRQEGWPIGSSSKGYYLARNRFELQSTIDHLTQRANVELRAAEALGKAFRWQEAIQQS